MPDNGRLVGGITSAQSTTIQAATKAKWTAILGTALSFALAHVGEAIAFVPPEYAAVASAVIQLGTALGVVVQSRKVVQGRIAATQRIITSTK